MTDTCSDLPPAEIPVVILCGGAAILIDESGSRFNKARIPVAGEPLVIHVLRSYLQAGFRRFILATGLQGEQLSAELAARYGYQDTPSRLVIDGICAEVVTVDTGAATPTGARLQAVRAQLGTPARFCVTYCDTVSTVDPSEVLAAHRNHGRLVTMLATQIPTRFRILGLRHGDPVVYGFMDQPLVANDPINGGFYVFEGAVLGARYLGVPVPGLVLETTVLEALVADRQVVSFPYRGPWHFLDSERDIARVTRIAEQIKARGPARP